MGMDRCSLTGNGLLGIQILRSGRSGGSDKLFYSASACVLVGPTFDVGRPAT